MKLLSLFSGVGGLDCAVESALGATVVAHCEADAYCRKVLARHWPAVPCFADVRALTAADVGAIDCICGGFPCTDLSVAGKQAGLQAARSGLWFEYLRLVRELQPGVVVIENVPPLYRKASWRHQVERPLAELGYRVIWTLCKASDVGAPHRRERVFALAVLPGVVVPQVAVSAMGGIASWPTPQAHDEKAGVAARSLRGNSVAGCSNLNDVVAFEAQNWPTPRSEDSESSGAHRGVPDTLTSAVRLWPTITASDANQAGNGNGISLTDATVRGKLWTTPTATDERDAPAGLRPSRIATGRTTDYLHREVQEGLWATPSVACAEGGQTSRGGERKGELLLGGQVQEGLWTTPTCRDERTPAQLKRGAGSAARGNGVIEPLGLQVAGEMRSTPVAHEARLGCQRRHKGAKGTQISVTTEVFDAEGCAPQDGKSAALLNPDWEESLVGLPVGWTRATGEPQQIDWSPLWPAGRGAPQHDWEPPRVLPRAKDATRRPRLRAIGNIVVPQQAMLALARLFAAAADTRVCPSGQAQGVLL